MTPSSSASEGKELNKAFLPPNSLLPQVAPGSLGTSPECHACIWILPLALGEGLQRGKPLIEPATAPTSRRQGEPRSGCTDQLLQLCQPGQVTAVPGSFAQRRPSPPPAGTPRAGSPGRVAPRLPAPGASPAASSPPIPRLPPPRPSASLPSRLPPRRGCSIESSSDSLPVPPAPSGLPKALRSSEPGAGGSRPPTGDARASPGPEPGTAGRAALLCPGPAGGSALGAGGRPGRCRAPRPAPAGPARAIQGRKMRRGRGGGAALPALYGRGGLLGGAPRGAGGCGGPNPRGAVLPGPGVAGLGPLSAAAPRPGPAQLRGHGAAAGAVGSPTASPGGFAHGGGQSSARSGAVAQGGFGNVSEGDSPSPAPSWERVWATPPAAGSVHLGGCPAWRGTARGNARGSLPRAVV